VGLNNLKRNKIMNYKDLRTNFYCKTGDTPIVGISIDCSDDSYFKPQSIEVPAIEYMKYLEQDVIRLESLLEWIPVKKELPKEEDDYFTLHYYDFPQGEKMFAKSIDYFEDGRFTNYDDEEGEDYEVFPTYWMRNDSLPPLPEDV
jgi:hypothetical protein